MSTQQTWLLPEGIDELMPKEAAQLEKMHRLLVDEMRSWGYQLVVPPLVEYLDSLLTGTAKTLDLQTFKLIDQMSGRLLGIRADMTPQVARIASHRLRDEKTIQRLCYIGSVLHTLPVAQATSRNPIQLGAEIYGHAGPESDMESIELMVSLLRISGVTNISLDIGHVGIYRGLAEGAGLTGQQEQALFSALQRKASTEIEVLLTDYALTSSYKEMFTALAELNGDATILSAAQILLKNAPESVQKALNTLIQLSDMLASRLPASNIHFDLAELRGYHYHTGVVFAAYQTGNAQAIALGGRYDDIGENFGYAQPATGFSLDLKKLVTQFPACTDLPERIAVVWQDDPILHQRVTELRSAGSIVVYQLPGEQIDGDKQLILKDGHWQVIETGTIRG